MSKNDYFKLLGLPHALQIDHNELKKNYFTLLKINKADPLVDPESRANPVKISEIETAYSILKDRIARIKHLLEIGGLESANTNSAPQDFLNLAAEVATLIQKASSNQVQVDQLRALHGRLISEFSAASLKLTALEKQWDEIELNSSANTETKITLLQQIKQQAEVFCAIRTLEVDLRKAAGM